MLYAGICGTDRNMINYDEKGFPPGEDFLILGHEATGRVEAVGPSVQTVHPGVTVVPTVRRGGGHVGDGWVKVWQWGAGRIGQNHAANVALNPRAGLAHVVDVDEAAAGELAAKHGARASEPEAALGDGAVDAVLIASSTDTHAELVEAAARAGKAIFCEKPIDLDLRRVDEVLDVVEKAGVPFFAGFTRRFDPSVRALPEAVAGGRRGKVVPGASTTRAPIA